MRIKCILVLVLLLFPAVAYSAPTVSGISGSVINGESVIISGSDFGTKTTVAPKSWDNFESQTVGNTVANTSPIVGPNWTLLQGSPGADSIVFDNDRSISGSKSVQIDWYNESINAFGWINQGPIDEIYITFWAYETGTYVQGANNHKMFYVFGTGVGERPQYLLLVPGDDTTWGVWNNEDCGGGAMASPSIEYDDLKDSWARWEVYGKLNSVGGTGDGLMWVAMNGTTYANSATFMHRCTGVTGSWDDVRLGNMWQQILGPTLLKQTWFDDVYIDTVRTRVELCAGSTWATRGICHIQRPTSWAADSVTITTNQGNVANGQTRYLYVVDSTGAGNIDGYEVVLGDTEAPVVNAFTIPETSSSLTVAISSFTCTGEATSYCMIESASSAGCSWFGSAQGTFIFPSAGAKTLYAFCRDAALNVSDSANDSVTITLPAGGVTKAPWRTN